VLLKKNASASVVKSFESEIAAIREAPEPMAERATVFTLLGLIATIIVLVNTMHVDRVVVSQSGKMVSTEVPTVFQALDPSLIKSINVKEGDLVDSGQLLATLDPTFTTADVDLLRQQLASLDAQIARNEAEQSHKPLTFPERQESWWKQYKELQTNLYGQRRAAYDAQLASFNSKIEQSEATIKKLKSDVGRLKQRGEIAKEIEGMRTTLEKLGSGSRYNQLLSMDSHLEIQRNTENQGNALVEAQHLLASIKFDRETFLQQWLATIGQDLVNARNGRDSVQAQLEKASRRQELVRIVATEPSVVLTIPKKSSGSVLNVGDELLRLVPLKSPLEAEIHILARDVGFLKAGDRTTLKVESFNYMDYGTAEGSVRWISEGAFTIDDNTNQPTEAYYKARVGITAMRFVKVPANFRLMPGMTLTADVNVGRRTVATYLFNGVMRGFREALREP
jgi:hemolysin D